MRYSIVIIALLTCFSVSAQTDTARALPTIEITAQTTNRFAVGQFQINSDSQTLRFFQGQRLADWLQAETPLSIRAYGTGNANVAARGMAASHTAVVWNGITLQNALNGGVDLNLLAVGSTDRVGVKLGGGSALYGSGAIGGSIFLDNNASQKEGFNGEISLGLGRFGFQNQSAKLGFGSKKASISVGVSHQKATNDFTFINTAEIGKPLDTAQNAAFKRLNLTQNFSFNLSKKDILKVNLWQSLNRRQITPTMTEANNHAVFKDTAYRAVVEWAHFFTKSFIKIKAAYLDDNNRFDSDMIKNSQNRVKTAVAEGEYNHAFSEKHNVRFGANFTHDESVTNNFDLNKTRTRFALFANDVLDLDVLKLSLNVRQEMVDGKAIPFTFSTGFEMPVLKKKTLIIRGSISKNYNLPALNDLYWNLLGKSDLLPESGWSQELGLTFTKGKEKFLVKTGLTVFNINLDNRILWQPQNDGIWRPNNLTKMSSRGIELMSHFSYKNKDFMISLAPQYQLSKATDEAGNQIIYTPLHSGGVSLKAYYKMLYVYFYQMASSRRYMIGDNSSWTNPFTMGNLTVGVGPFPKLSGFRSSTVFGGKMDVRLHVFNIWNTDYQVIRFYPNAKRYFSLEIAYGFN
jgi:vitamin B12 transporter